MNKNRLNSDKFIFKNDLYNLEFEGILKGIIACYRLIIDSGVKLPKNNENKIRDHLLFNYLKNQEVKNCHIPLADYLFDGEYYERKGRPDIRVLGVKPFCNDNDYFLIECKRLDGGKNLSNHYVNDGINRYTKK